MHIKRLKQDILLSINVLFSFLLDSNKLENLFMTISFLNPRFRKFNFISDEKERKNKLERVKSFIDELFLKMKTSNTNLHSNLSLTNLQIPSSNQNLVSSSLALKDLASKKKKPTFIQKLEQEDKSNFINNNN